MVHEVRYQEAFLTGIFDVLKPGGCLMVFRVALACPRPPV